MAEQVLRAFDLPNEISGAWIGSGSRTTDGPPIRARSPVDGRILATITTARAADVTAGVDAADAAFKIWRLVPAPTRGEFVRRIGLRLRERKADLAALISWEVGKITQEALGEVQEVIDTCDFAVGLSRQLYGLTIASERPGHRMMEQWHPLGPVGVITAFNFPVAVWAWNAMLALVCGDPVIWKPSEKAALCALAVHRIVTQVAAEMGGLPESLFNLVMGDATAGGALAAANKVPLISATGSVRMGRAVAIATAHRLGRCILELGGNNGLILAPSADLELAIRAIVFAAAGTAGQRCTTLRRLIVHRSIKEKFVKRLVDTLATLRVGNPLDDGVLIGPLIDESAWTSMQNALAEASRLCGRVAGGQRVTEGVPSGGVYVRPAVVEIAPDASIVCEETFAPILYVHEYDTLQQAIDIHNSVPQGLSSAIFTNDLREAETFISAAGSDCGMANVNIGTSGAEIGGAFGGEKTSGGGRESGSDAWKAYMRRMTNTINYSTELPLAQGIRFE